MKRKNIFKALFLMLFIAQNIDASAGTSKTVAPQLQAVPNRSQTASATRPLTPPLQNASTSRPATPPPAYSAQSNKTVQPALPTAPIDIKTSQTTPVSKGPRTDRNETVTLPNGRTMTLEMGALQQKQEVAIITKINTIIAELNEIKDEISSTIRWSRLRFPWYFRQQYILSRLEPIKTKVTILKEKINHLEKNPLENAIKTLLLDQVRDLEKDYFEEKDTADLLLNTTDELFQEDDVFEEDFDIFEFEKDVKTLLKTTQTLQYVIQTILKVGITIRNIHVDAYMWCTAKRLGIPNLVIKCAKEETKNKARVFFGEMKTIINRIEDRTTKKEVFKLLLEEIGSAKKYFSNKTTATSKKEIA